MEYSKEEIDYVAFCVDNFVCKVKKRKCPIYELCCENGEGQEICNNIPSRMKNGEVLSEEDRGVIRFFQNTNQQTDDCFTNGTNIPCPNIESCNKREDKAEKRICDELIQKINPTIQKIAEKVIQNVIIKNVPEEWYLNEKVSFDDHEKEIREICGRTDIQLKGLTTQTLYIVELKIRATREHVGQLASYVGWYKKHLPEKFTSVEGILLAEEFDKGALSALEVCPDLTPRLCNLRVTIEQISQV
jgi:hypothetical protein